MPVPPGSAPQMLVVEEPLLAQGLHEQPQGQLGVEQPPLAQGLAGVEGPQLVQGLVEEPQTPVELTPMGPSQSGLPSLPLRCQWPLSQLR